MQFLTPDPRSQASSNTLVRWMPEWIGERDRIEAWFEKHGQRWMPPAYASVDIRHSASKVAVIDTNLFSAGFNNLDAEAQVRAVSAIQNAWKRRGLNIKRVLLLPERHTRNAFYIASLSVLKMLIEQAGAEVRVGYWHDDTDHGLSASLEAQGWERLCRVGSELGLEGWMPDIVVLNNDLSSGVPEILKGVSTLMTPSTELGWHHRLKSTHFAFYQGAVEGFAAGLKIDGWPLHSAFRVADGIDFHHGVGIEELQHTVAELLESLKEEYRVREIAETPYVVIKPDAGTYGMGVMTVHDASELAHLNRKQRNKMSVIKDGVHVHRVLVQEGIYSEERWLQHVAESVLYMVDTQVVGRFYRVHPERDAQTSLNAPGMVCEPVPLNEQSPEVYLHTIVARLALIAAARELDALTTPVGQKAEIAKEYN